MNMKKFIFPAFLCITSCSQDASYLIVPQKYPYERSYIAFHSYEDSVKAYNRGVKLSSELQNYMADFKGEADSMVHVSTFHIKDNTVFMSYYANKISGGEIPRQQLSRFVLNHLGDASNKSLFFDLMGARESGLPSEKIFFDGKKVEEIYDTILIPIDNDRIMLMWAASLDGLYTRLFQIYHISTEKFDPIGYNYFMVNNTLEVMDINGIETALTKNGVFHKPLDGDIGIMQKVSSKVENGVVYYYTGCYANNFNCIIKSKDFVTWEYVSSPDFDSLCQFENATYLKDDKIYYFCRQEKSEDFAYITFYDLENNSWHKPVFVRDAQSRYDFFEYGGELYAVHSPIDRNHLAIMKIDTEKLENSRDVMVAVVPNYFYPFVKEYNGNLYMSFTVSRKHICLSKFTIDCDISY